MRWYDLPLSVNVSVKINSYKNISLFIKFPDVVRRLTLTFKNVFQRLLPLHIALTAASQLQHSLSTPPALSEHSLSTRVLIKAQ